MKTKTSKQTKPKGGSQSAVHINVRVPKHLRSAMKVIAVEDDTCLSTVVSDAMAAHAKARGIKSVAA